MGGAFWEILHLLSSELWFKADMEKVLWMVVTFWFVCQVLSAGNFNCTVSRNGDKTTYTVSADPRVPIVDMSEWDFYWINGTNFTIADNSGQIPPVLNSSIYSLTTSKCLEGIVSTGSKNTGLKDEYRTICNVTCSGKDFSHREEDGHSKIWIAVGVVTVTVIPVLAGLAFLCYNIWRKRNCSQYGGRYRTVKTNPVPTPAV